MVNECMSEEVSLFLLTSTQAPYIKDALDLLFLPSGMEYRFRYRKKWLSETFHDHDEIKNLINKNALLIHVDSKIEDEGKYKIIEFIPFRKAKIIEARDYGEILWLSFSLGDWVKYKKLGNGGLNQHHNHIKELTPDDSKEYVKQILYFVDKLKLEYIEDDSDDENVLSNWFNIVLETNKLKAHKELNSIYTKLLSIKNFKNGNKINPNKNNATNTNNDKIISLYDFTSDAEYLIEILQYYPKGNIDQPFKLKIIVDEKHLISLKQEDIVQGRYDLLKYVIKTPTIEKDTYSYIQFKKEGASSEQFTISMPIIIVKIKGSQSKLILSSIFIFAGLLLTGLSLQLTQEKINNMALLYSVIGSTITTLGTYHLRKK